MLVFVCACVCVCVCIVCMCLAVGPCVIILRLCWDRRHLWRYLSIIRPEAPSIVSWIGQTLKSADAQYSIRNTKFEIRDQKLNTRTVIDRHHPTVCAYEEMPRKTQIPDLPPTLNTCPVKICQISPRLHFLMFPFKRMQICSKLYFIISL